MLRRLLIALVAPVSALATASSPAVPFFFVQNGGQGHGPVEFIGKGAGLTAAFSPGGVSLRAKGRVVRVTFGGLAADPGLEGMRPLTAHANFLRGPEQEWRLDVPLYGALRYRGLYPGIDLVYSGAGPHLKSEFHVAPGADPGLIAVRYRDAGSLRVLESGDLAMTLNGRELREHRPVAYQETGGHRVPVEAQFVLTADGAVNFRLGEYNLSEALVIDPVMSYSTLLGGSSGEEALGLAVDASGSAYLTGFTESYDFPTANPEQSISGGGNDTFIAKLSPSGNGLVYCTYIGGWGDDRGYGIAVDSSGAAYVAGSTSSPNFPVKYALQSKLLGPRNAFVVKLNPAGNSLMFSTFLGGNGTDVANGIALDSSGNAYLVGDTTSTNFPVTGLQKTNRGSQDAFVTKLSADGSRLLYSTFLGGSANDHGAAIAVDPAGTTYVTGSTYSSNFPVVNAYQSLPAGGQDAFVARLAGDGNSLLFSTYLGGSGGTLMYPEGGQAIALDSLGNAYVAGVTSSPNFPLSNAVQSSLNGSTDAFVSKFGSGGTLIYSTYLGGSGIEFGNDVAVDAAGEAIVTGYTYSTDLPVTSSALQRTNGGDCDAFLAKLSSSGSIIQYLSYLGGNGSDTATAVALDTSGAVYLAGWTLSTNFPVLNGYQSVNAGNFGAWVAKFVLGTPPTALGVSPNTGSGLSQTFSFQFSDPNGASDLTTVSGLVNATLSTAAGCSVSYSRTQNTLWLLTDSGAAPTGTLTPGSGSQQNSQCVLNSAASSVNLAGSVLTLNVALTFQAGFSGGKSVYLQASSPWGTSNWQALGSWTVSAPGPSVVSVTPNTGSGLNQTFNFQFSDPNGATDLTTVSALFNTTTATSAACSVTYNRAQNTLWLLTDSGTSPTGTLTPGGSGSQQNSQCTITGAGASVSTASNVLTLNLAVTFQTAFVGAKNIYLQAASPWGTAPWQSVGTWSVTAGGPSVLGVTPNSGSGLTQTFAFRFSDPNGASDLTTVSALINTATSVTSTCSVTYNRAQNTLLLLIDSGASPSGTLTPGGSGSQQNSQCTLTAAGSSVGVSGNVLTLSVALTFQAGFVGTKNIYMQAISPSGTANWQNMGSWTVPAPVSGVTVISVTPSSGSGLQAAYTLQAADSVGASDWSSVWIWFSTSLTGSAANSCLLYYSQANNRINLIADSGSTWLPPATLGATGTLANSECSINLAASSIATSGATLTLNLALSFTSAFAGTKNIYADAFGSTLNSGWQSMGTWSVAAGNAPSAVSVTPNAGSGSTQTFNFQVSDPNGATDLTSVSALINSSQSAASACSVTYNRAQNSLSLLTDSGASPSGTLTPGGSGSQQNSQCTVNATGSSAATSGNVLTLNLALTFSTAFSGTKNIYLYAAGSAGNSGWQNMGSWTVPAPVSGVTVSSVTPSSGSGLQAAFTLQAADSAGASDWSSVWMWFNTSLSGSAANSCLLYYSQATNRLNLIADSGSTWLPPAALGATGTLANSQCSINLAASSIATSGATLTLNLALSFTSAFAGTKNIYADAFGSTLNSGWQSMGTWSVAAGNTPCAVSVTPNTGSGPTQTFNFQVSDPNGATDLTTVSALVNAATSVASACSVTYNRAQNTLSLLTDSGASPSGTLIPGGSGSQQNSQCTLNAAGSSVAASGNVLTLNLALTFSSAFSGTKNIYLYAAGSAGNSGWQNMGSWTVPAPVSGVTVISVTPSSGSGLQAAFTLQAADSAGASDWSSVWMWFNTSLSGSAANSCLIYYSQANNRLNLIADSGSTWLPPATLGVIGTLANSECSINLAASSIATSGTTLTLNLALSFTSAFAGAKNIYADAFGSTLSSGWQSMGTWSVP